MRETVDEFGRAGRSGGENASRTVQNSAAILRTLRGLLTSGCEVRGGREMHPSGLAHMVGVCLLEVDIVARGPGKGSDKSGGGALPRFVDVKLTADDRKRFLAERTDLDRILSDIAGLTFNGYRFGCSWSGEHQSYTVSMTCRDPDSPNAGCCMTSFAGDLATALRLALFKHSVVCGGEWGTGQDASVGGFG